KYLPLGRTRTGTLGATRAHPARSIFQQFSERILKVPSPAPRMRGLNASRLSDRLMNSCRGFIFPTAFRKDPYAVPLRVTPNLTLTRPPRPGHGCFGQQNRLKNDSSDGMAVGKLDL